MNKIWYLSTCDTCRRIIKELELKEIGFEFIDLKNNPISKDDLEFIKNKLNCSYENLFNKRAQKYTKTNLKEKIKLDNEFKDEILKEYTFLKRPIIQINNSFFVGNSKKTINDAEEFLKNKI